MKFSLQVQEVVDDSRCVVDCDDRSSPNIASRFQTIRGELKMLSLKNVGFSLALSPFLILCAGNMANAQEFDAPAIAVPEVTAPASPAATTSRSFSVSPSVEAPKPLTFPQQVARYQAEQRMLRMQWNQWIGYSPLRPNMNSSYMSNGLNRYYIPSRGIIVTGNYHNGWYW